MQHPLLVRAMLGSAGLAACIGLLSGVAKAAEGAAARVPMTSGRIGAVAPNVFGTLTVPMKVARYADDWERARRDDSSDPRMRELIAPAAGMAPEQQIFYVQAAVYRRIHWMSDATEYGQHDYWASAAETLQNGAGDMEDRAILKMQALRALGFSTRDLYLTMGRDAVGGPITVLMVRLGGRYYILDDNPGRPYTTDRRPEFKPQFTFGYGGSWIHGYPVLARAQSSRSRVLPVRR
jgi:predicted transglutaminase-like cysteine proteinase